MARKPSTKPRSQRTANSSKRSRGRPSAFKPEYCRQAQKLCDLGATDEEIAEFFGTSARSLYRWKERHPEFCQALKAGKEKADERVIRSLYHRAVGYTYDAIQINVFQGVPVITPHKEHVPPDVTAAIFWLKNRQPEKWRDKHEHSHDGTLDVNLDEVRGAIESKLARIAGAAAKTSVSK